VVNKVDTAEPENVATVEANIRAVNPRATVLRARSPVTVRHPDRVRGKRVLVIEDGPTLTHGEMRYGAGWVAARQHHAAEIVDPRPYARGSIRAVFEKYAHLTQVLPAMGYGDRQIAELSETIAAVPCDSVLVATPIDLAHVLKLDKPSTRVTYELDELDKDVLPRAIAAAIERRRAQADPHPEVSHGKH
jgi:predicted GTPase